MYSGSYFLILTNLVLIIIDVTYMWDLFYMDLFCTDILLSPVLYVVSHGILKLTLHIKYVSCFVNIILHYGKLYISC